jgi:PTS system N-acetylglucosamine-specific IIC component
MMFGLPAACLAMYHTARPEQRKAIGGLLASMALTAFLTGVTEPIEFSFMFLAPPLYAIHAVLTGLSMVVMNVLNVRLGFGFSAGLFDYVVNFNKSTHPLMLLPVGAAYFVLYYGVFRFAILKFDLKTPGRDAVPAPTVALQEAGGRGRAFAEALGGAQNLQNVDACTTRLRLVVKDSSLVDESILKALGARGFVRPGAHALQVVLGPIADQVAGEIRAAIGEPAAPGPTRLENSSRKVLPKEAVRTLPSVGMDQVRALLEGLGGAVNVRNISTCSSRLRVGVHNIAEVDEGALRAAGSRGVGEFGKVIHVVIGPAAEEVAALLRTQLESTAN